MPNWTANSLKLIAKNATSEAKLAQLVREIAHAHEADEVPQIFNMIKPIPRPLQIVAGWVGDKVEQAKLEAAKQLNLKLYGYQNWYDFCVAEWGTKWEPRLDETMPFDLDGHVVTMWFDTAWAPPIGIYHALEAMGFDVEATYVEQGMGFIGYYKNGQDVCEEMGQFYVETEQETYQNEFDPVPEKIDRYFDSKGFTHSPTNFGG
jgi:hypothetical protein